MVMPKKFLRAVVSCLCLAGTMLLLPQTVFGATALNIGGTGAALGTMRILAAAYNGGHPDVTVTVAESLGSGGGIRASIAGAIDIGLSSRPLKPAELKRGAKEIAYAKSPFVLVTNNKRNGIDVSSDRIVDIFSGRRTTWQDGTRIRVILRPRDDSDYKLLMKNFSGIGKSLAKAQAQPSFPIAHTDQEAMDLAEKIEGSITTATYSAVLAENRSLSPLAIDGVAPTLENLASGSYKISKILRFVLGPNTNETALDFIRFVESSVGAEILRRTGNLPL